MRGRNLIILALITAAVIAAAIAVAHYRAPHQAGEKPLLFPELAGRVNDVAEIHMHGKDRDITLQRRQDGWVIGEMDGYPALFNKVRETLVGVADLRIVSEKTSNPELFDRLGVEDPSASGSNSILLTLRDGDGKELAGLIVGKDRRSGAPADSPGLYVRLPDAGQALLLAGRLNLSVQKSNWFERDLLDIRGDRIQEIRIDHGDGAALSLRRESADADFVIDGLPEGKEAKSEVVVSRMETMLENFFVDGARTEDKVQFPPSAARVAVKTLDGLTAAITAAQIDELPMAKITFQYEAPPKAADKGEGAQVRIPGAASTEAADEKVETGIANEVQKAGEKQEIGADGKARGTQEKQETDDDKAQKEDVAAEVEKLQQAVSGWVFEIPQFKFELLTRRLEDLVQDRPPADQKKDEAPAQ